MHVIEDIGPILGIVAFLGFAILALLIVLQAREVRRLREWAGRAPERAVEADDAALAAGEAREGDASAEKPSRVKAFRQRVAGAVRPRWDELDRRSPVDPVILLGAIVAAVVVAVVLTSGFGLFGGESAPTAATQGGGKQKPALPEVAVLNATEVAGVSDPVPGIADLVAKQLVQPADFAIGVKTDALAGESDSVVMFEPEAQDDATTLADDVSKDLGQTDVQPMTEAVRGLVKGAPLALLVGAADRTFGGDATATGTATTP